MLKFVKIISVPETSKNQDVLRHYSFLHKQIEKKNVNPLLLPQPHMDLIYRFKRHSINRHCVKMLTGWDTYVSGCRFFSDKIKTPLRTINLLFRIYFIKSITYISFVYTVDKLRICNLDAKRFYLFAVFKDMHCRQMVSNCFLNKLNVREIYQI